MRALRQGIRGVLRADQGRGRLRRARAVRQGDRAGRADVHQGRGHPERQDARVPGRHGAPRRRARTGARARRNWPGCSASRATSDGWFHELDYNTDPTGTERGGVYVAGVCQGPKDIPDTVAQASAVAARVLRSIVSDRGRESRASVPLAEVEARARTGGRGVVRPRGAGGRRRRTATNGGGITSWRYWRIPGWSANWRSTAPSTWSSATTAATAPPPARSPRSRFSSRGNRCASSRWGWRTSSRGTSSPGSATTAASARSSARGEAEPGETMMSMRRWLTSKYDFTGISRLFYRSWKIEVFAILLVALLTGLGFYLTGSAHGNIHDLRRPGRLPARRDDPPLRLGDGGRAGGAAARQLRPHVVVHASGATRRYRIPLSSYFRGAWLAPAALPHAEAVPRVRHGNGRGRST